MFCTVKGCLHANTHTLKGHKCRKCGIFGHGIIECGSNELISNLKINLIPEEDQCSAKNCNYKAFHMKQGHLCRLCDMYGHGCMECTHSTPEKIASVHGNKSWGKIYLTIYEGMGCLAFCKRDDSRATFKCYHMHSDSWGQYGNGELPQLKKFLDGYKALRDIDMITE